MRIISVDVVMRIVVVVVIVLIIFLLISQRSSEGFASFSENKTIWINCSSYRDRECLKTITEAMEKAERPERVYIGVCQQNKELGEDCTLPDARHSGRIKMIQMDYKEARGPTYARYLCNTLYDGQDYILQIDSHTRFVRGWDSQLIDMIQRCPAAKPVLTHYPHSYDVDDKTLTTQVPVMCRSKWNSDGLPTFEAVMKPITTAGLQPVPFIAGGMLFAPGSIFQDCPLDPGLDFLFQGEELLLAARLYTHGWDFYTPSKNVVLHHYVRESGPRFWQDLQGYRDRQSQTLERVKQLLALARPDISMTDPYGMGTARTLQDYWAFAGLDPSQRTSTSAAKFC